MEQYSNFITPPDHSEDPHINVLLIDADWLEVEAVAMWCKTANRSYNVYLYSDIMLDEEWLALTINRMDHIIVNMADSAISQVKGQLLKGTHTWYYGPRTFLGNKQKIERPLDWFISHDS